MKILYKLFVYDRGCIPFGIMGIVLMIFALLIPRFTYADTYWRLVWAPVEFTGVIETDTPGGRLDYLGYADRITGKIQIKSGLRSVLRECVISHEMKHLAGYTHEERIGFATDCGDGRMVSIQ